MDALALTSYSAIPFVEHGRTRDGCDCWGLLVLIYREQFGIELPSYTNDYATTGRTSSGEIADIVERERLTSWREISEADAQPGDVLLLRLWNRPMHVGIVLEPGRMLHTMEGAGVCIARYNDREWLHRKLGFYRHHERSGCDQRTGGRSL